MKTTQVFDPALCCSSDVCGVDVDPALAAFSADAEWARSQGAQVERFNLAQWLLAPAAVGSGHAAATFGSRPVTMAAAAAPAGGCCGPAPAAAGGTKAAAGKCC